MPAVIPLAIVAAGAGGAAISASASKSAANTQANAANNANATQMAMFNKIQGNEQPWIQTGGAAQNALAQFYGLPTSSAAGGATSAGQSTPDYSAILSNLPGYQFQMQQGTQAVQRNLAAQGLLQSGAAGKALQNYGQGLAQNYASQYASGLQGLSQLGEAGAAGVASAGMNAANQIGSNQIYAGNAGAQGTIGSAAAMTGGLGGLASLAGYYGSSYGGGSSVANPYASYNTPGSQIF